MALKRPSADEASGDVFDLCALAPRTDSTRFVKQRVIVFGLANSGTLEDDSALKAVGAAQQARDVLAARFPLDRFHNVVTRIPGKAGWEAEESISLDELQQHLSRKPSKGDDPGAVREGRFVAYSAACADYLVFPSVTSQKVEWVDLEIKTKSGTRKLKAPRLKLEGSLAILKHEGAGFKRLSVLTAEVPGMLDFATDLAASAIPDDVGGLLDIAGVTKTAAGAAKLPAHISAFPDEACALGETAGARGLTGCSKVGVASAALAPGAIDERASPVCKKVREENLGDEERSRAVRSCEVRTRVFQWTRSILKQARGVEGWRLFAPLQGHSDEPAISLGKEEGVGVGFGFVAEDTNGERLAYFKTSSAGPGGVVGIEKPSSLSERGGDAPQGAVLKEHPQIGVGLMPQGGFAFLTYDYGRSTSSTGTVYTLPGIVGGGGLTVSYDLSSAFGLVETHLRLGGGFYAGSGTNTTLFLIPVDVSLEKGFYVGSRGTFFLALGPTTTQAVVTVPAPAGGPARTLNAGVYGFLGRVGLDLLLVPDASFRVEGVARVNLSEAGYAASDNLPLPDGWEQRKAKDHLMQLGPEASFNWIF